MRRPSGKNTSSTAFAHCLRTRLRSCFSCYVQSLGLMNVSVGSIDEVLNGDSTEHSGDAWRPELADRIEEILARKGSTVQGREKCYKIYIHILTSQYAEEEIRGKEAELVVAFLKSIKEEKTEKETILAMKGTSTTSQSWPIKLNGFLIALAMTLMTSPSDLIYEAACTPLRRAISHSPSTASKAAAIHTLGTCTFYGGASEDAILENMDFLLEIITSDGYTISAPDEPEPVTAALEEWGFLCTLVDDMSAQSEDAVEAFAEQITSSFPSVQIAAGENIALLFEKSFKPLVPDQDRPSDYPDTDIVTDPDDTPGVPKLVRLYPAYRRTDQLLHSLHSIASLSTHHLSKTDRKALRTHFADILNSVEVPTRGPRYQNAISDETGRRYGSRMVVRVHRGGVVRIDRWWKLARLQGLKRVLQGGFVGHYERNELVFETLPGMMSNER